MKVFAALGMAVGFGVILGVTPLVAHHSFSAEFDADKQVTLIGTINKMEWVNPHSWLHIDVKQPDGTVVSWAIEFGLPQGLYRRGWRQSDLPIGAEVTVEAYLARDGTPTANAFNVTLPDGRRLFAGSSGSGAPYDSQGRR